ncbi:MAG: imidazole glycerol phosphate synthase subunit HisH [Acidimicrobiia bacterium]|nr:imidazole glycerol phosphate synthase subunit HisH [Acidimicrobiia bacterium]
MSDATRSPLIAVLDYGIGNLHSAQKALGSCGADARLTTDAGLVADADGVVLPGVGAFGACMNALRTAGLEAPALAAADSGRPFLGICVGMQMLFDRSEEDERSAGLGVIPGTVVRIPLSSSREPVKVPQMQWNRLDITQSDPMFAGLGDDDWFYFVHSLHGVPEHEATTVATVEYGTTLNAVFRSANVFAVQFHPEKSGISGLRLLSNFAATCGGIL